MLILNDSTPIRGHDPKRIREQLHELAARYKCGCILLDLQRENNPETQAVVHTLLEDPPCPFGVSPFYAKDHFCPVFLPPCPTDILLEEYLSPWTGREVWLEAALDGQVITLKESGVEVIPQPWGCAGDGKMADADLCTHYRITQKEDSLIFSLWRTPEDLTSLLEKAHNLGVTKAVGLWQELGQLNRQESICPNPRL